MINKLIFGLFHIAAVGKVVYQQIQLSDKSDYNVWLANREEKTNKY